MDSTTPKVSFIPKGSLVRETAFLERRRPRSAIGLIAILSFIASVGSYAGLSFYNDSLEKKVVAKTDEINKTQKIFSDAPQVGRAQVFRARAELAQELLNKHMVVSPVFDFLSKNTTESILYEKFSFTRGVDGATAELAGEAPNYAALAYQGDILREATKDISKFEFSNISLTKFGAVSFVLSLTFKPESLLYSDGLGSMESISSQDDLMIVAAPQDAEISTASADSFSDSDSATSTEMDVGVAVDQKAKASTATAPAEKQSMLKSLWLRFKFW
ncbi:MAG: hypothetical protein AAB497_01735 [Patescibacteria group bacterium]